MTTAVVAVSAGSGGDDRRGEVHLRHAVGARALVADHHDVARLDSPRQQRLDRRVLEIEDARRADVDVHLLRHREVLDHRAARREVAAQHGDAALRSERIGTRAEDLFAR